MGDEEYKKAMEIQRRNFEAQFGSLDSLGYTDKTKQLEQRESDSSSTSSADEGDEVDEVNSDKDDDELDLEMESDSNSDISSSEDEKPQVFKLGDDYSTPKVTATKQEKKLLRLGRAPTLKEIEKKEALLLEINKKILRKTSQEEGDNLENDMQLQRLLQESHILSNTLQYSGADLTMQTLDYEDPTGNARKRVLTSRIKNIASINSKTDGLPKKLEKMPMSMRKGMINTREKKIEKFEREAKDAGIILAKVKKGELRNISAGKGYSQASDRIGNGKKQKERIRDRGLKIHAVGRSTRNGLVISKDDIERINNGKRKRR